MGGYGRKMLTRYIRMYLSSKPSSSYMYISLESQFLLLVRSTYPSKIGHPEATSNAYGVRHENVTDYVPAGYTVRYISRSLVFVAG